MNHVTVISSEKNWLEQSAVDQLHQIAALPGVEKVIGLPDLHPGKIPVGAVIITKNIFYPHLIGNDIGCGMALFMTDLEKRKCKPDKLAKRISGMQNLQEIALSDSGMGGNLVSPLGSNLGTIGGGNHFAELQEVETVFDTEQFERGNPVRTYESSNFKRRDTW